MSADILNKMNGKYWIIITFSLILSVFTFMIFMINFTNKSRQKENNTIVLDEGKLNFENETFDNEAEKSVNENECDQVNVLNNEDDENSDTDDSDQLESETIQDENRGTKKRIDEEKENNLCSSNKNNLIKQKNVSEDVKINEDDSDSDIIKEKENVVEDEMAEKNVLNYSSSLFNAETASKRKKRDSNQNNSENENMLDIDNEIKTPNDFDNLREKLESNKEEIKSKKDEIKNSGKDINKREAPLKNNQSKKTQSKDLNTKKNENKVVKDDSGEKTSHIENQEKVDDTKKGLEKKENDIQNKNNVQPIKIKQNETVVNNCIIKRSDSASKNHKNPISISNNSISKDKGHVSDNKSFTNDLLSNITTINEPNIIQNNNIAEFIEEMRQRYFPLVVILFLLYYCFIWW